MQIVPYTLFLLHIAAPSEASGIKHFSSPRVSDPIPEPRKKQFETTIAKTLDEFQTYAKSHGAISRFVIEWDRSGYGAFTMRRDGGKVWEIRFFDGILRLHFTNDDVVSLIACYEISHHIAGYPFNEHGWVSVEGQADYFASHACLPKLWETQTDKNREFRDKVKGPLKTKCDLVFKRQERRDICYRTAVTMEAMLLYEGYGEKKPPGFETTDQTQDNQTNLGHPSPLCRIDTELAEMLCRRQFDFAHIPGHFGKGENTPAAEVESNKFICHESRLEIDPDLNLELNSEINASRPACWFAGLGGIHG